MPPLIKACLLLPQVTAAQKRLVPSQNTKQTHHSAPVLLKIASLCYHMLIKDKVLHFSED